MQWSSPLWDLHGKKRREQTKREGRKKECVATVVATAVQQQHGFTKEEVGGGAPLKLPFEKGFFSFLLLEERRVGGRFPDEYLEEWPLVYGAHKGYKAEQRVFSFCRKKHETQATRRARRTDDSLTFLLSWSQVRISAEGFGDKVEKRIENFRSLFREALKDEFAYTLYRR